jgi:hypothetical protein
MPSAFIREALANGISAVGEWRASPFLARSMDRAVRFGDRECPEAEHQIRVLDAPLVLEPYPNLLSYRGL